MGNGGFVEVPNPFEEVSVTPTEVINATLGYIRRKPELCETHREDVEEVAAQKDAITALESKASEHGASDELADESDDEDFESRLCNRLACLQNIGIYSCDAFQLCEDDLLPDDLSTLI